MLLGMQKKNGEPQRYSWEHRKRRLTPEIQLGTQKKKVNHRDTAGNTDEEEEG